MFLFQYNHIFNLLRDIFGFNEIKDGDIIKDTLKILLEFDNIEINKHLIKRGFI
mgnify:CR=1 FL=1